MGPGVLLKIAAVAGDLVFVGVCVEMLSVSSLELKPLSFDEIPLLGVEVILGCSFTLVLCCTPG